MKIAGIIDPKIQAETEAHENRCAKDTLCYGLDANHSLMSQGWEGQNSDKIADIPKEPAMEGMRFERIDVGEHIQQVDEYEVAYYNE